MEDTNAETNLTKLAEVEKSWQSAVDNVMSVREDLLNSARQDIVSLRGKVQELEALVGIKDKDIDDLRKTLQDANTNLASVREEMASLQETSRKKLEEMELENKKALEAKEREMEEIRTRHKLSIQELTRGTRETLQELETQLDKTRETDRARQERLARAEVEKAELSDRLERQEREYDRTSEELSQAKDKLKNSRYTNGKLREQIYLLGKYCDKMELEANRFIKFDEALEMVVQKLNLFDTFIRGGRHDMILIVEVLKQFGTKLLNHLQSYTEAGRKKLALVTVETQTDLNCHPELEETCKVQGAKIQELWEELKKRDSDLENLTEQNTTLREVVKGMKRERDVWEREREQIEEEFRVAKLEECVRLLKKNFINEQKDECIWSALQDVKKEVSSLKSKKIVAAADSEIARTDVAKKENVGKPVRKEPAGSKMKLP